MTERSGFQRFLFELRRRHVPQTAAVYMVAAWAAIEFSDVVVPNLGWPESIITAVIVAAAIGLPVVLVLAWVFDWGEAGLERTPPAEEARAGAGSVGPGGTPPRATSGPWVTALSVLVVGVTSALAVAVVLDRADGDDMAGGASPSEAEAPETIGPRGEGEAGDRPALPEGLPEGILSDVFSDSMNALLTDLADLERLHGLDEMRRVGERFGAGRVFLIGSPESWTVGTGPEPLAAGDTLHIQGVARDTAGVLAVTVDGRAVAASEGEPRETLPFVAQLVGTGSRGERVVPIALRTADGREVVREYRILQIPGG